MYQEERKINTLSEEHLDLIAAKVSDRLADKLVDEIAERVEVKLKDSFAIAIGNIFITKFFKITGALIIGLALYFDKEGFVKRIINFFTAQ